MPASPTPVAPVASTQVVPLPAAATAAQTPPPAAHWYDEGQLAGLRDAPEWLASLQTALAAEASAAASAEQAWQWSEGSAATVQLAMTEAQFRMRVPSGDWSAVLDARGCTVELGQNSPVAAPCDAATHGLALTHAALAALAHPQLAQRAAVETFGLTGVGPDAVAAARWVLPAWRVRVQVRGRASGALMAVVAAVQGAELVKQQGEYQVVQRGLPVWRLRRGPALADVRHVLQLAWQPPDDPARQWQDQARALHLPLLGPVGVTVRFGDGAMQIASAQGQVLAALRPISATAAIAAQPVGPLALDHTLTVSQADADAQLRPLGLPCLDAQVLGAASSPNAPPAAKHAANSAANRRGGSEAGAILAVRRCPGGSP